MKQYTWYNNPLTTLLRITPLFAVYVSFAGHATWASSKIREFFEQVHRIHHLWWINRVESSIYTTQSMCKWIWNTAQFTESTFHQQTAELLLKIRALKFHWIVEVSITKNGLQSSIVCYDWQYSMRKRNEGGIYRQACDESSRHPKQCCTCTVHLIQFEWFKFVPLLIIMICWTQYSQLCSNVLI